MSNNYDRSAHMKTIHAQRKANTYQKVDEAIKRLIRVNESINFNSISNESGVSKVTLYNNVEFVERIETFKTAIVTSTYTKTSEARNE